MATLSTGHFSTASKRSRSQQSSPAPLESPPAPKATKTEETEKKISIPAFLRQSKAGELTLRGPHVRRRDRAYAANVLRSTASDVNAKFRELNWQEKLRIVQGRSDPESKWMQEVNPHVLQRNRYLGVQPWDKSRIHLRVAEGDSDYINASPITLQDPRIGVETTYIATQGPKKNVLSHFWQMVRHETKDVAVIVMLTPTEESGREKCFQYFPLDAQSSPFKIESVGVEDDHCEGELSYTETTSGTGPNTVARKLQLTFGSKTKTVWHFLFTAFPDFGVPEDQDRAELLELVKLSAQRNSGPSNPKIIHCSAGVGRSGTFIALEFLLAQLKSGAVEEAQDDEDMVHDVVHRLREQRMMMVQMENQFQFLYDILREEFDRKLQPINVTVEPPSPKQWKSSGNAEISGFGEDGRDKTKLGLQDENTTTIGDTGGTHVANPDIVREVPDLPGS